MGEINCRVTLPVPSKVVCVDVQGVAGCESSHCQEKAYHNAERLSS